MPIIPRRSRRSTMLMLLCGIFASIALFISLPQPAGAWWRDKTVNIKTHANAAGLQLWKSVNCTSAVISVNGRDIQGSISERRTNGCAVEWPEVPVNTPFTYRITATVIGGGTVSGSLYSNGVGAQTVGHTALVPEIVMR